MSAWLRSLIEQKEVTGRASAGSEEWELRSKPRAGMGLVERTEGRRLLRGFLKRAESEREGAGRNRGGGKQIATREERKRRGRRRIEIVDRRASIQAVCGLTNRCSRRPERCSSRVNISQPPTAGTWVKRGRC